MKKIKVGILGATGLVGQNFVNILSDHPYFDIGFLGASEKSADKIYGEAVDWKLKNSIPAKANNMKIIDISLDSILKTDVKVIFSALPSEAEDNLEKNLRKKRRYIFSNSSKNRMDPEVPIIITEINYSQFKLAEKQKDRYGGFIITNSNCVVSGLVFALKPLLDLHIKSVVVSSYQAISGAGIRGISAFEMNSNIIPYIKNEESKIETEPCKILGDFNNDSISLNNIPIFSHACRVGVLVGHLESITLELGKEVSVDDIKNRYKNFTGEAQEMRLPMAPPKHPIILCDKPDRPQPAYDSFLPEGKASGMAVVIGRIGKKDNFVSLYLLVNNLLRGAAGQSVLNAEYAYKKGILGD